MNLNNYKINLENIIEDTTKILNKYLLLRVFE